VRCYDRNKDSAGGDAYLETVIKEKSTSVVSELAMSMKIGRLTRSAKYDEAVVAAQQLLNSATDGTLRKYALYDLATLLYHFLNDKQNGEKYYRQLLAEYPIGDQCRHNRRKRANERPCTAGEICPVAKLSQSF